MYREPTTDTRLATVLAAFASAGAGAIHVAVVPDHWQQWPLSGMFFAALALFQLAWAAGVVRWPRPGLLGIGLLATVGAMGLWAYSRVWGVPFGPHAGIPEAVDAPGVLTMMLEASVVLGVTWSLLPRHRSALLTTGGYRFAVTGAALAMLLMMTPGVIAGLEHSHSGAEGRHGHNEPVHPNGENTPSRQPSESTRPPTQQTPAPSQAPTSPPADGASGHHGGYGHGTRKDPDGRTQ